MKESITLVLSPLRGELPKTLVPWTAAWAQRAKVSSRARVRSAALFWTLHRVPDAELRSLFGILRSVYRVGVVLADTAAEPPLRPLPPRTRRPSNPQH